MIIVDRAAKDNFDQKCVLAIDPALSTTGYAVINVNDIDIKYVDKFTTSAKYSDDDRIDAIVTRLFAIAAQYNVRDIILEDGFLGKNAKTAMQLAQLRGAIIEVFRFNQYHVEHMLPSEIRHTLGIGGNASKEEVAMLISNMYKGNKKLDTIGPYSDKQNKNKTSDMYDALGIGVAYCKKKREKAKT